MACDEVYLYTGLGTETCRWLGQSVIASCKPITIGRKDDGCPFIRFGKRMLSSRDRERLAIEDGFQDAREMVQWFEGTYKVPVNLSGCEYDVFSGFLIQWAPL